MLKILKYLIMITIIISALPVFSAAAGEYPVLTGYASTDSAGQQVYIDPGIRIRLDGNEITTDTPPAIVRERTLVPARAVFEAMGGTAAWNNDTREVTIAVNDTEVKLSIDSTTALVDGDARELEVPATIINDRTMVPVRFIAEAAGSAVAWDNDNRIVQISSPAPAGGAARITDITLRDTDDAYVVEVKSDKAISDYDDFMLNSPDRFVLDVQNAALQENDGPIAINNGTINAVRYSQFDAEAVRVVVDLEERATGKISRSADKKTIYIEFGKKDDDNDSDGEDQENTGSDGSEDSDDDDRNNTDSDLPELDHDAEDLLVFIDPGHGGIDTGAIGFINGEAVVYEKDINLDVALRLNDLLEDAGVNTYMLRQEDSTITLQERPAAANSLEADLYISIHNNSSDNLQARGVEVLYYSKASDANYDLSSLQMAEIAQAELVSELGIPDRTIKERPALAVLNKTAMPAIIIEGAFISNQQDLSIIMTDDFREQYALAAARAIIKALNESVED